MLILFLFSIRNIVLVFLIFLVVMQETYGLKVEMMTLYNARAKAKVKVFRDPSKGYKKLFEYVVVIYKADLRAICKVLCDVISLLTRYCSKDFFVAFLVQKNT